MTIDEKKKTCNMLMTVDWKNARMNIGIVNLCKGEKMSKLNIDQQTIKELFENKKSDFLIPDYQRPYAWGEIECQTLWDDIFSFAFPENDYSNTRHNMGFNVIVACVLFQVLEYAR